MKNETYLGDGLYASFDGFSFELRAPRMHEDHHVVLEPAVLQSFLRFVAANAQSRAACAFRLQTESATPVHETLRVFVNGACAGLLTLRLDEAAALRRALEAK